MDLMTSNLMILTLDMILTPLSPANQVHVVHYQRLRKVISAHHTESWLLSLYSALGFVYLGWTHNEYFPSR